MHRFKPTITIGIPAHNEEKNIASILVAIIRQKKRNYKIAQIIVACDGCTDNTAPIARRIARKYSQISIMEDGHRRGKSARLNEMFSLSESDVFVALDADTMLAKDNVLDCLVRPFRNPHIGLTSGNDKPYRQKGYLSRITYEVFELWYEIRKDLNHGDSVHNIHGPMYAMRREVYKACKIPNHIHTDDHFVYFKTKLLGYDFLFVKRALVNYLTPANLQDYFIQHSRYLGGNDMMISYFGSWVKAWYSVPYQRKISAITKIFAKNPVLLIEAITLQIVLRIIKPVFIQRYDTGRWKVIESTKIALV